MLRLLGSPRRCCDGITRRETLQAGTLAMLAGLGAGRAAGLRGAALETAAAGTPLVRPGRAKSVIMLYLLGGAPGQDMFDLKPQAPAEVRGDFQPIATSAPGVEICEHLPKMARWMHRAAVVRSVHHQAGCHNTLPSYSGYEAVLDNIVSTKYSYPPSMGSVCQYLGLAPPQLPAYVYMPCYLGWGQSIVRPGPYAGFLGSQYDPLFTECAPTVDNPPDQPYHAQPLRGVPQLPGSSLPEGITLDRLDARRRLLTQFDDEHRRLESHPAAQGYGRSQQQAFDLLTSAEVKRVFDLAAEDPALRERYTPTLFGQSALLARRLVEAGVTFVNVTWDCYWERLKLQYECWDLHARNCAVLKDYNLPYFDATFSALMEDLEQRGLLDETLVVVMTDFGRTPKINANAGRDHWTFCYSLVLAGAGIQGGVVHGASDAQAAFPTRDPVSTGDICATIYHCLGIDPAQTVPDRAGRPVPIAHGGEPIQAILA